MRITHRMLAQGVTRNVNNNMYALNQRSNQLSTGKMFDRPSQDPVGTYKVMRIAGTGLARNEQYRRNIGEGISWLSSTEDALAGAIDAVQRLREISVYAANEIFTPEDRRAVAPEVKQLLDYLISIGNTELAGLYIFGGHKTDQEPYAIAGDNGAMIDKWHNAVSGLDSSAIAEIGIEVDNLATGNYAVSTVKAEQTAHLGYARFEGDVTAPAGTDLDYTLKFGVDGVIYQLSGTIDEGTSQLDTIDQLVDAINAKSGLKDYIKAESVAGEGLRIERIDRGGKSFELWGEIAGGDITGLASGQDDPAAVLDPALQNITDLNVTDLPNFLEGDYKVVTNVMEHDADAKADYFQYSQSSGDILEAVTVAPNTNENKSLLLKVSEINSTTGEVTFAIDGSGTLVLNAGADNTDIVIDGVGFDNITLGDIENFNVGDKTVINVTAAADTGDTKTTFYREGEQVAAFTADNFSGAEIFSFFQLDTDPGSPTHGHTVYSDIELSFNELQATTVDKPAAFFTVGPTATVVAEHLNGAREGFFGTDKIKISNNSAAELTGSVALEILEAVRYEDLSEDLQKQVGGEADDRIIRLSARSLLRDTAGTSYEDTYGLRAGEDIYINLNQLRQGGEQLTFQAGDKEVKLNITGLEPLTYEHNIPLVGDRVVLQLHPPAAYFPNGTHDRFTLHRDYGRLDETSRPTTGDSLSWHFENGVFDATTADSKKTVLKFFDIDPISGDLFTSTLETTFKKDSFATAEALEYRGRQEILTYGVPDEEFGKYPAAIFTNIAAGDPYYRGDGGQRLLEIAPGVDVPSNISGFDAFDPEGKNGVALFRAANTLYEALIHNDQTALGGRVLEELDENLDQLLKNRSEIGARMERFMVTEERQHSEHIFLRELRSKVEDIDMAKVITEFTMQENVYQASLATGARMVYPSLIDFLR